MKNVNENDNNNNEIIGYHQEFLAKYNDFSESLREALKLEKRFWFFIYKKYFS